MASSQGSESSSDDSKKLFLAAVLFFLSGASSLIYQVIWTRQMVFVFGSSTFASSTVLSSFMGGLALGSFIAGKFADKLRNPFLLYGILEGVIGLWALAAPFMFSAAMPLYKIFWQHFHLSVLPFSLLRFMVVALILIVPTACMGATLPLLSRFVTTSISTVGNRVGTLYAINTFGAVGGAIAGGFFLIPTYGLSISTSTAAAVNLLLAAVVTVLTRTSKLFAAIPAEAGELAPEPEPEPVQSGDDSASAEPAGEQARTTLSRPVLFTMIAFGISGGIAMIYEVAWTRSLLLIIGSTTYAFSIMLSTFLIGISLGSLQAAKFADKARNPAVWFATLQVVLGLAGIFSLLLFNFLPYWNLVANRANYQDMEFGMIVRFLLSGAVLLPVALFLGAIFPLAVKACTVELSRVGRSIGTLYSINTLGAIIGSFAGGFLIIPLLGSEQTLICCAAANLVLGAAMLSLFLPAENKPLKIAGAVLAIASIIWAAFMPQVWDQHIILASQKLRRGLSFSPAMIPPYDEWRKDIDENFDIRFWKDGLCALVSIVQFRDDKRISLFTSGHIDASDGASDMPTQALLPTIPLLLKPDAADVCDIGWGSGCTMGYALQFPVKHMICAEIEPAVIETSKFFHRVNLAPEDDPRLKLEINDGRNFLLATDDKYDLITSEPSNPWQAGVCNLYTQEFFQTCHNRLKPGGIFTMWWQCNEVATDDLRHVFASLKKVFNHLLIFQTFTGDIAVCASDQDLKIDLESVRNVLKNNPKLAQLLRDNTGLKTAEDLPISVCMVNEGVAKVVANLEPNTDDHNIIEYDLARSYEQKSYGYQNQRWMLENGGPLWDAVNWGNLSQKDKALKMAGLAELAMLRQIETADKWAQESIRLYPNSFAFSVRALILAQQKGDFEAALTEANKSLHYFPDEVRPKLIKGIIEQLAGCPFSARRDLEAALKLDPDNKVYRFRVAQTYLPEMRDWYQAANVPMEDSGKADTNPQKVIELISPSLSDPQFVSANPTCLATMGTALIQTGKVDDGIKFLIEYRKYKPDDIQALRVLAGACKLKGDREAENFCNKQADELSKGLAMKIFHSAQLLIAAKKETLALAALRRALNYNPNSQEARYLIQQMAMNGSPVALDFAKELAEKNVVDEKAYAKILEKLKH